MKICHVSFGLIDAHEIAAWLDSIEYHTKVLESLATRHQVTSFHYWREMKTIVKNGVEYRFLPTEIFLSKLISAVKLGMPDVIVLHGMHQTLMMARFVSVFSDVKIYAQHHGEQPFRWPKSILQKFTDRYISGYMFSSIEIGLPWIEKGSIENSSKIFQVLEATSSFEPSSEVSHKNLALTFLWVGRIDCNKDPETLIEGFTRFQEAYPNARLIIISKDNSLFEIKLRHKISGKSIEFVGPVRHHDMQQWYEKANFIISTSHYEGSGIAVLEAMSAGCIPILTRIPSFQAMTNNGEVGFLFTPRSGEALVNALCQAAELEIPSEQKKVFDHFRKNLSADSIASRIEEYFTSEGKVKSSTLL